MKSLPVMSIIFLVFFVLYLAGASPEPVSSDAADLALAGFSLAPAHPPGYLTAVFPLKAFTLVPLGSIAFRCAAACACLSAVGLALMAAGLRKISGSTLPPLVGALLMGLSPLTLAQSTRIEVYAVSLLLSGALLHEWMTWRRTRQAQRAIALFFLSAIAVLHHPEMMCFAVPALACTLLEKPRPSPTLIATGAFLSLSAAGLLAALVFRANASWETASLAVTSLRDLVYYATAEGFRNFTPFTLDGPYRMLLHAFKTIFHQYGTIAWAAVAVGMISVIRRDRILAAGVAGGVLINLAIFAKGGILPDFSIFLADTHALPTTWLLSIFLVEGVSLILRWVRSAPRPGTERPRHRRGPLTAPMEGRITGHAPRLTGSRLRMWGAASFILAAVLQSAPNLRATASSRADYPVSGLTPLLPRRGTILGHSVGLNYYALYLRNVENRPLATPIYVSRIAFDPNYRELLRTRLNLKLPPILETMPQPVFATNHRPLRSTGNRPTFPSPHGFLLAYPAIDFSLPDAAPPPPMPSAWRALDPEWLVFLQWMALNRAESFLEGRDLENAEREARTAAEFLPSNPAPRVLLGNILASNGKIEEARSSYRQAVQFIENQKSWTGRGPISPVLDTVLSNRPNMYSVEPLLVQAYNGLGTTHLTTREYSKATDDFADGLRVADKYGFRQESRVLRFNLALAYTGGGETERAIEVYRALLETAPDHIEALNNCAALLLEMDRPAEALPMADRLLTSARDPRPLQTAGLVFLRTTRHPQAIAAFERALTLGTRLPPPEIQRLHLHLADAYLNARQLERAEAHRKIAREIVAR